MNFSPVAAALLVWSGLVWSFSVCDDAKSPLKPSCVCAMRLSAVGALSDVPEIAGSVFSGAGFGASC